MIKQERVQQLTGPRLSHFSGPVSCWTTFGYRTGQFFDGSIFSADSRELQVT